MCACVGVWVCVRVCVRVGYLLTVVVGGNVEASVDVTEQKAPS